MEFQVRKKRDWKSKPCEGAKKKFVSNIDVRSIDSPYKIWNTKEEVQKNWFREGKNHRLENGKIVRDLPDKEYWVIELETLEELIEFQEKNYEISISEDSDIYGLKVIEIKD